MRIFTIFLNPVFSPRTVPDRLCRPTARSTVPGAGRPGGRPTCTAYARLAWHLGRSTGPESLALWKTSVDRPIDRSSPTVDFSTVGGRPPAVSGCKNSPTAIFWRGLFKPHLFGFLSKIFKRKDLPILWCLKQVFKSV